MKRLVTFLAVTIAVAIGCGGDDDANKPKTGNGVNDLKAACGVRQSWKNRSAEQCSLCEAGAVAAFCECEAFQGISAACAEQENARKTACDQSTRDCASNCDRDDCACIEGCYANAPEACKKAADARDGCVAETCTSRCN